MSGAGGGVRGGAGENDDGKHKPDIFILLTNTIQKSDNSHNTTLNTLFLIRQHNEVSVNDNPSALYGSHTQQCSLWTHFKGHTVPVGTPGHPFKWSSHCISLFTHPPPC